MFTNKDVQSLVLGGLVIAFSLFLYLLTLPQYLASWDSIQFALGLEEFNIEMHMPHPPGYIGHMGIAWLFSLLGVEIDRSVQLASIVETTLASVIILFLGKNLSGRIGGLIASLLFASHPVTWFYAISGESYGAEALFSSLLFHVGIRINKGSHPYEIFLFFALLGVAGGFRQNLLLYFFPFAVYCIYKVGCLQAFYGLVGACIGLICWLAPLLLLAGGIEKIAMVFFSQFFDVVAAQYSLIMNAEHGFIFNFNRLWRFLLGGISIGGGVGLLFFFINIRKEEIRYIMRFLFWLIPPFIWFFFMFIFKQGHLLIVIPVICLFGGMGLSRIFESIPMVFRYMIPILAIFTNIGMFLSPPFSWTMHVSECSYPVVQYSDTDTRSTIETIRNMGDADSILIVTRDGGFSFREAMLYLEDIKVIWLVDSESTGIPLSGVDFCESKHHKMRCKTIEAFWLDRVLSESVTIHVSKSVSKIVWFAEKNTKFYEELKLLTRTLHVAPITDLLITDLPQVPYEFRIGKYTFISEN